MENNIKKLRARLREAIANYMYSEGCSCCQSPYHEQHAEVIAKLLNVRKYKDGSGYDFSQYRTGSAKAIKEEN